MARALPAAVDFLDVAAARVAVKRMRRTRAKLGEVLPDVGTLGDLLIAEAILDPLVDDRLSGRRMNAENRAWLAGRFSWVDGGTGIISIVGEGQRLGVILNNVTLDRGYLIQARIRVHNDFPRDPIRIVVRAGGDDRGTNFFVDSPPPSGIHVLPAFVIARGPRPNVSFMGGKTVYSVIDLRAQQV